MADFVAPLVAWVVIICVICLAVLRYRRRAIEAKDLGLSRREAKELRRERWRRQAKERREAEREERHRYWEERGAEDEVRWRRQAKERREEFEGEMISLYGDRRPRRYYDDPTPQFCPACYNPLPRVRWGPEQVRGVTFDSQTCSYCGLDQRTAVTIGPDPELNDSPTAGKEPRPSSTCRTCGETLPSGGGHCDACGYVN